VARIAALSTVCQAIEKLLDEAGPRAVFAAAQIAVVGSETIRGDAAALPVSLPLPGISIFPYSVTYNAQRRATVPRVGAGGERFRASLFLDLHLLVTAWSHNASEQLRLLAWAVRKLEDTPVLLASYLNRFSPDGQPVFDPAETVELVAEPLTSQDLVNIWEIDKSKRQPSLGYVARMIVIDSDVRTAESPLVRVRTIEHSTLAGSA
jgi:hypothetical protein